MKQVAIAIDLGGTEIKSALVDQDGTIVKSFHTATGADRSPEKIIALLTQVIAGARTAGDGEALIGVGIGSPGGIVPSTGIITQNPNFPGWRDVDLCGPLRQATGLRVIIDNDANVAGLGEFASGAGKDVDSMVLVTLGTGIGGGIVLDGRIWRGAWGMAGEIGHVIVEADGLPCGCGGFGCVEQYASGPAIVRQAREGLATADGQLLRELVGGDPSRLTPKIVYQAARQGCPLAGEIFRRSGRYLGMMIASVLNVLNVPLFAIGGGVSAAFDLLVEPTRTEVRRRAYRIPADNVRIERATLGNDAGIVGAGMLAFAELTSPTERRNA